MNAPRQALNKAMSELAKRDRSMAVALLAKYRVSKTPELREADVELVLLEAERLLAAESTP